MAEKAQAKAPIGRRIIAISTSWEDVENLNLVLGELIQSTEGKGFLPLCIPFDRSGLEARGETSLWEYLSAFDIPNLAGFLLFGEMIRSDVINGHLIELAREKRLPVFMLERQYEGCINMSLSYSDGFEKVVRHLVEGHGCTDIVMVAGIQGNSYSDERIDLCRQILEEHGGTLPPERILYGDYWDEPTRKALDAYFAAGGQLPQAFICANDAMAIEVCIYLADRNIQVPAQVLVAGFDGILQGEDHAPTIATAKPDYAAMFDRMLERIASWRPEESGSTEVWSIPFELKRRESCGCEPMNPFETMKRVSRVKTLNLTYTRHIRVMGNFIRGTLSMNSLEKLADRLPPLFSVWENPYHFAAVLEEGEPSLVRPILHGIQGRYVSDAVFHRRGAPVPDLGALCADPAVRIVLAQLLQNEEETMGYLVSGMEHWNLWEQERFEELVLFLSSALNAVIHNQRLEKANREILQMAEHDYLTGLFNRRGFFRELERLLALPENQSLTLTLFAMDMDRLKHINDVYGHQEGDNAIFCLAKAIQKETEGKGICARYGGDEFAFALLAENSFLPVLEEIRGRIEAAARQFCGLKEYRISASLGGCSRPVNKHASLDQLLAQADHALYADKTERRKGRAL